VPFDESVAYYWTSLGLSAAAVFLFLWLLRVPRRTEGRDVKKSLPRPESAPVPPESPDQKASRAET
jgi:hypothetical protein